MNGRESRAARYNTDSLRMEATRSLITREDFADFIISALFQMHVPTTLTTQNGGVR